MQGQNYYEKCLIQINYFKNESLANRTLISFSDDDMKWISCEVLTFLPRFALRISYGTVLSSDWYSISILQLEGKQAQFYRL